MTKSLRAVTCVAVLMLAPLAAWAAQSVTPGPTSAPTTATAPPAALTVQPSHGHAPAPAAPGSGQGVAAAAPQTLTGAVLEQKDAGGYTYLRLKTAHGEAWAAVKQAKVAVGATVTVLVQMTAENFESKALGKTFDRLAMGTIQGEGAPPAGAMPANPHAGIGMPPPGSGVVDEAPIKVDKAEGPDGKTVAEIWASRAALKDGKVAVRGKVVKFLASIMGKNWIHLRDGSGSKATGDNDITVTTSATAAVGDIVLVKGTVRVDKDFGAGYTYAVIIEDAALSK